MSCKVLAAVVEGRRDRELKCEHMRPYLTCSSLRMLTGCFCCWRAGHKAAEGKLRSYLGVGAASFFLSCFSRIP